LRLRPFSSVDDMVRISGIGSARLRDIKGQGLACVE
jgi:competence protein ComEC